MYWFYYYIFFENLKKNMFNDCKSKTTFNSFVDNFILAKNINKELQ